MSISRNQPTKLKSELKSELKPHIAGTKIFQIHYCSAGPVSDAYGCGMVRIREDQLATWIFEQLRSGKPVLITDMDEM